MSNSWDYPPYPFLSQVLQHCPQAGKLYLDLWKTQDKEGFSVLQKKEISSLFYLHPLAFKRKLLDLCSEGVCSLMEEDDKYVIEFISWDKEFDDL